MAPQTRRMAFPKMVIDRDTDSEKSSSEEEEEEEEEENDPGPEEVTVTEIEEASDLEKKRVKGKKPITISLKKVCKVCKRTGHEAGFKGATYIDCPMKPCFLCKMPGHTTMTCPHRVTTEYGVIPAPHKNTLNPLEYVFQRQLMPRIPRIKPTYVIPDEVNCGVIRYHSRRITCLEFHPTNNNILLSGDKKGQLGVWDFCKVTEKIVYPNIHSCLLNNMRFSPTNDGTVYAASSDGTISCTDIETGMSSSLLDLNPDGWHGPRSWKMLYGMDINSEKGLVLVADSFGFLHLVDSRSNSRLGESILIHKKGSKVVGLHCNPLQPELLLSCGNDHFARIWDMRRLEAGSSLDNLSHNGVVNSAYFSPLSGSKILTDLSFFCFASVFFSLSYSFIDPCHCFFFFKSDSNPISHLLLLLQIFSIVYFVLFFFKQIGKIAMSSALESRRLARRDLCASIFELPEIRKPLDGSGAAVKAEERNACSTSSFPSSPSCSSSSSIGKNSDLDHSASSSEVGDGGGEDEVQSRYKGTLDSVNDLEEALPFRRGISRFYNGKSKSFTSLAAASSSPCIKEIAKPENAYTRKRKNLLAFSHVWEKKGGISKRPLHLSRSTLALAVAMGSSDSISDASSDSNSSSNAVSPTATALPPLHPSAKLSCSPWRSFSVADLQQCSGGTGVNVSMYDGGCYSFFK